MILTYLEFVYGDELELVDGRVLFPADVVLPVVKDEENCVDDGEVVELRNSHISHCRAKLISEEVLRTSLLKTRRLMRAPS